MCTIVIYNSYIRNYGMHAINSIRTNPQGVYTLGFMLPVIYGNPGNIKKNGKNGDPMGS